MRVLENVSKDIWKLKADSNMYLLNFEQPIVIDTGNRSHRESVIKWLDKVRPLSEVKHVIFTHLHFDHAGNFDLFTNARFYASDAEMQDFKKDPDAAMLDRSMAERFKVELQPVKDMGELYVIETPGHTRGSICLWYAPEKILFSGDTLFYNKHIGRQDLPTSAPEEMQKSLMKLVHYNYQVLCPGHDY
jgi:glyoxylase-like metal-dependent hydrolase (beta-lactamase superfamily II)